MHLFETISTSALSQAFGWTLFHSLWQGLFWVLILSLVLRYVSRQKAQLRYVASLLCLVGLFAGSLGTFLYEFQLISTSNFSLSLSEEAVIVVHPAAVHEASTPGFWENLSLSIENWGTYLPYFSIIWGLGVLFFSLKWLGSWMYIKDIRRNSTEVKFVWQNSLDELAYKMNIRRYVGLRESSQIQSPMVIGHLKPLILLPVGMLTGLSAVQLEAILAHELAHIRRYDFLVNLLQSVMEILFFYHPAQWWISNQIRDEREHCCDDSAVKVCGNPMAYAKALANLEEIRINQVQLAPALSGRKSHLLNRIQRLLTPELVEKPRETRVYFLSLLVLGFCAMFFVNPGYTQDKVETLVQGLVAEFSDAEEICEDPVTAPAVPLTKIRSTEAPVAINSIRVAPEPPMIAQISELQSLAKVLEFTLTAVSDTPPPPPPIPAIPPVPPVPDMSGMPTPPTPPNPPVPMIGSFDLEDSVAMRKFELQMEKFGKEMEVWGEKYGKQMESYSKQMEVWSKEMEKDWEKWGKEYEMDFGKWEEKYGKDWEKWGEEFGKKWEKWAEENEGKFEEMDDEEKEKLKKEIKNLKEEERRLHREDLKELQEEQMQRMEEVRTQLREVQEEARREVRELERTKAHMDRELSREMEKELRQAERLVRAEAERAKHDRETVQVELERAQREMERAHAEMERAKERANEGREKANKLRLIIEKNLIQDGLLSGKEKKLKLYIGGKDMKVNGKKVDDSVYQKYLKILKDNGIEIKPGQRNSFVIDHDGKF